MCWIDRQCGIVVDEETGEPDFSAKESYIITHLVPERLRGQTAAFDIKNKRTVIVEKDRRDANSKVEQCEQEVQLLKRVIDEEKTKTDQEIEDIVLNFQKMEKAMIEKFDKFDGYFVTPYYPAQKKVLDLGVKWYFFN